MKWLDLTPHDARLFVGQRAGYKTPSIGINCDSAAHATGLHEAGFRLEPGRPDRWWADKSIIDRAMWRDLHALFPEAPVIDCDPAEVFDSGDHRQVSYTKLGEHRGRQRLWLEGLRLAECGFVPGSPYSVTFDLDERTISLELTDTGERTVSRRRRKRGDTVHETPIIDLASPELTEILGEGGRVRVTLFRNRITFDLHPVDQAIAMREARTRENISRGVVTEGTLCAGGGVSTQAVSEGFAAAGLTPVVEWVVDRDRRYLQSSIDNAPAVESTTVIYEAALEELVAADMAGVDVVQVSLPCTGHSLSGRSVRKLTVAEQHPTDALAVVGMIRILDAVQPSVVISENVVQARDSASYALVLAYLQEQGYCIAERVMDSADAGTVEHRERWWFVAVSKGLADNFTLDDLAAQDAGYRTLGEAMEHVPADDSGWAKNEYLAAKAVRDKAAGKGFARQFVGPSDERVGTIGRGYAKRRSTEPFIKREDGMERLLTPREHARVKGIPESIVDDLSQTIAHEILGQSILYGHAVALAERVGTHLRATCVVQHDLDSAALDEQAPQKRVAPGPGM